MARLKAWIAGAIGGMCVAALFVACGAIIGAPPFSTIGGALICSLIAAFLISHNV